MRWVVLVSVAIVASLGVSWAAVRDRSPAGVDPAATVPAPVTHRFDADAAWRLVELQVAAGQRPAGSAALRRLASRLRAQLPGGRLEPVPGQPGLRNVVGRIPGSEPPIVIGAHYDTLAAPRGFVGANNGAAGSAVVVELARAFARAPRPAGARALRFVLFDGEEPAQGLPEADPDFRHHGLRGSRAYVRRHPRARAMVLLDYVGNRGLRLPREGTSDVALWSRLRAAARRVGVAPVFPAGRGTSIVDDHTPFLERGIPAIDLIDWRYPGHSLDDRIERLSPRSLDAVGESVFALVGELRSPGG